MTKVVFLLISTPLLWLACTTGANQASKKDTVFVVQTPAASNNTAKSESPDPESNKQNMTATINDIAGYTWVYDSGNEIELYLAIFSNGTYEWVTKYKSDNHTSTTNGNYTLNNNVLYLNEINAWGSGEKTEMKLTMGASEFELFWPSGNTKLLRKIKHN